MDFRKGLYGFWMGSLFTGLLEGILWFVPELRENYWNKPRLIFGYHIHHSILGLLFIILGIYRKSELLIGIGLGIIIVHTITDGNLIFVGY